MSGQPKYFITSKKGQIEYLSLFEYTFSEALNNQPEQKEKFISWLEKDPNILLLDYNKTSFTLLSPLTNTQSWQYSFLSELKQKPPFENTMLISYFLSRKLNDLFSRSFEQYQNKNSFVVEHINLFPFHLLKCFRYNIEVFKDGIYYVHFISESKIVSAKNISSDFIDVLLSNKVDSRKETDDFWFNIVVPPRYFRQKYDFLDKEVKNKILSKIGEREDCTATFDYHFVANYSPEIFGEIVEHTIKDLDESLSYLQPIIELMDLSNEGMKMTKKPFLKIEIHGLGQKNNLLIGDGKKVKEQKAAYYSGMYESVTGKMILPVVFGNYNLEIFRDLIGKFNKGRDCRILDPIVLTTDEDIDIESCLSDELLSRKRDVLITIFSTYSLPLEVFKKIKEGRWRYQLYSGSIDKYKLSNFTVKCLEKLNGRLSVINDLNVCDDTYFIGIDMGHSKIDKEFTILGLVMYNNHGEFITSHVIDEIPRNESINPKAFHLCMKVLMKRIKNKKLSYPAHIVFHRDGKLNQADFDAFVDVLDRFKIANYDVVEVIKSGFPVFAAYENGSYINPSSGDAWFDSEHKYALLATNVQVSETNGVIKPIIIKHKIGNLPFIDVVNQVYWFTKVYTNNLYNSTRLPASTEKANNIVGTGSKQYSSSYLA